MKAWHYKLSHTNKRFKNQHEQVGEAIEINQHEFDQGKSGYVFDILKKLTLKIFRYHVIRASSCCKLRNPFCNPESIISIQT